MSKRVVTIILVTLIVLSLIGSLTISMFLSLKSEPEIIAPSHDYFTEIESDNIELLSTPNYIEDSNTRR